MLLALIYAELIMYNVGKNREDETREFKHTKLISCASKSIVVLILKIFIDNNNKHLCVLERQRRKFDGNNNTKSKDDNDEALYFDDTNELKFTDVF